MIGSADGLMVEVKGALDGTGTGVGTATAVGVVDCCFLRRSEAVPTPTARPTAKIPPWMIGLPGMFVGIVDEAGGLTEQHCRRRRLIQPPRSTRGSTRDFSADFYPCGAQNRSINNKRIQLRYLSVRIRRPCGRSGNGIGSCIGECRFPGDGREILIRFTDQEDED